MNAKMKSFLHIIAGTTMLLLGIMPAYGSALLKPDTTSDSRWAYIYFDRIILNSASSWVHRKADRHTGHQDLSDRWYYHYGTQIRSFDQRRYYERNRSNQKSTIYSQPNYAPKSFRYRKPTQMRDHIPRNSFRYRSPFPRGRIGQ
jgi:hypothetical protein